MVLGSLFRQEALDHRSAREPIDKVAQVTVPYDWWVLLLLAAACLFVVLWAAFVKIELTLPVYVMVIKPTDDRVIESPVTARVTDVFVDVGVLVEEGDALVRVVVPDLHRRLTEAEERARFILGEMESTDDDTDLMRMLRETRIELAALHAAIESNSVIFSPYSGEILDLQVTVGHIVNMGQDVTRVRVDESVETFAIAFVPESSVGRISRNFEVLLQCPGTNGVETVNAQATSDLPHNFVESERLKDAGFDTRNHQLSLVLAESSSIVDGTLCEGHILLDPRTPMEILLSAPINSR